MDASLNFHLALFLHKTCLDALVPAQAWPEKRRFVAWTCGPILSAAGCGDDDDDENPRGGSR